MAQQQAGPAGKAEIVVGDVLATADGAKKVVVEMILQHGPTRAITELNRRVRELEQSGVDLCFFYFPEGDELLAFRRDGERLLMVGEDAPKVDTLNRLFLAYREAVEAQVRAELRVERLVAQLRAAGIDPAG